jgi:hypothetical protein
MDVFVRMVGHRLARAVQLLDVRCPERQHMFLRLKGRPDVVELARRVLHLDMGTEHGGDFVLIGEMREARGTRAIGIPVGDRQQARI